MGEGGHQLAAARLLPDLDVRRRHKSMLSKGKRLPISGGVLRDLKENTMDMSEADAGRFDVAIAGGGYVGLSLALALKQADPSMSVAVIDPKPMDTLGKDPRASAIAAAASRMLDQLGVWQGIRAQAQPINEMIVTDSRLRDAVRPVYLTFAGDRQAGEAFAHMVPNGVMLPALHAAAAALGVVFHAPDTARDFSTAPDRVEIHTASGKTLSARLLVAADGVNSRLRDLAGIRTVHWAYGQSGIVTTVKHERPHNGRAEEHFLPAGQPFVAGLDRAQRRCGPPGARR
jgi:2-octaprenyl-6-methoxyphenol hydroxylase